MRSPLLLAVALALLVPPAAAQEAGPPVPAPAAEAAALQDPAPPAPTGLPARAAADRTMRAYGHVFVAFAVTWVLLFGYALSLGRRFGRLDEEVRRLRQAVPEE